MRSVHWRGQVLFGDPVPSRVLPGALRSAQSPRVFQGMPWSQPELSLQYMCCCTMCFSCPLADVLVPIEVIVRLLLSIGAGSGRSTAVLPGRAELHLELSWEPPQISISGKLWWSTCQHASGETPVPLRAACHTDLARPVKSCDTGRDHAKSTV